MSGGARERDSRITTVELPRDEAGYIEKLMEEGRCRSLKEFVQFCVKHGRVYTLDRWDSGVISLGPIRALMIPQKMLEIILQRVKPEELLDAGTEMGEVVSSYAMLKGVESKKRESALLLFEILSRLGLGIFSLDSDRFQVQHPVLPVEANQGLLEELFGVRLEPQRSILDVHFFAVKRA